MTLIFRTTLIIAVAGLVFASETSADPLRPKRRRPSSIYEQSGNPSAPGMSGTPPALLYRSNPAFNSAPVQRSPYSPIAAPARTVTPSPRSHAVRSSVPEASAHGRNDASSNSRQVETHDQSTPHRSHAAAHKAEGAGAKAKSQGRSASDEATSLAGKASAPAKPASTKQTDFNAGGDNNPQEHLLVVPTHNPSEIQNAVTNPNPQFAPGIIPPAPPQSINTIPSQAAVAPPVSRSVVRDRNLALESLSENERAKLHSAHQAALEDPNVLATRNRYLEARKQYREQLRNALLKADPGVEPILDKVKKTPPDQH